MRRDVVEGEPGIFPDPIARFLRAIGRLFQRGERDAPERLEDADQRSAGDADH